MGCILLLYTGFKKLDVIAIFRHDFILYRKIYKPGDKRYPLPY
jgi:hypothetical protein